MMLQTVALLICLLANNAYGSPVQSSATRLAMSINDFGSDITEKSDERGNLVISPLSIYTALSMVLLGARGDTAQQIENAFFLHTVGILPPQLPENMRSLIEIIREGSDEYKLLLANALYSQQGYQLNPEFVQGVEESYYSSVKLVDFLDHGWEAMREVNQWIANGTNNEIPEFLQNPLDPATKLAALDAAYFKGTWKIQFDPTQTEEGLFYGPSTIQVPFMHMRRVGFQFFDDSETNYKFLELPYKGGNILMLLSLPNDRDSPLNLQMDTAMLNRISANLATTDLEVVQIPKAKIHYKHNLKDDLVRLQVRDVFTASADLSGISEEGGLHLSGFLHEAILEISEEGSEAPAASGEDADAPSAFGEDASAPATSGAHADGIIPSSPYFFADHPFMVHIIDKRNGLVLFSGKVREP